MPFNVEQKNYDGKTFEKTSYLKLTPGTHMVRFLQSGNEAAVIFSHFVLGKYGITCLGDDCPICANNKKIIMENPDNFRDVKGYYSKGRHFVLNVLDRTLVKICPNCQAENKRGEAQYPTTCSECDTMIVDVKPQASNKVKLLTIGMTLATQLNSIEKSVTDENGEPLGLTTFDLALAVEGSGRMKTVTPISNPQRNDVVEINPEDFQDPASSVIRLNASEILDLLRGVSLKDLFAARRSNREGAQQTPVTRQTHSSPNEDIKSKISKLFPE